MQMNAKVEDRFYATGKRKDSVARVWITSGTGKFIVNGKNLTEYFGHSSIASVLQPLKVFKDMDLVNKIDVFCTARGGGFTGQSGAIKHGISKALVQYNPSLKPELRASGLLTRDSRVVEPKKYGRHKARRSTQFSKR